MMLKSWGAESKLVFGEEFQLRTCRRPEIYTMLCQCYLDNAGGKNEKKNLWKT